jgi:hypothetical protein
VGTGSRRCKLHLMCRGGQQGHWATVVATVLTVRPQLLLPVPSLHWGILMFVLSCAGERYDSKLTNQKSQQQQRQNSQPLPQKSVSWYTNSGECSPRGCRPPRSCSGGLRGVRRRQCSGSPCAWRRARSQPTGARTTAGTAVVEAVAMRSLCQGCVHSAYVVSETDRRQAAVDR